MPYDITSADTCVFLTCEGHFSLDEAATAWREVQGILVATEWKRVWVDVRPLRTNPDTEDLFDLAKLLWRDFPASGRMALVARWDQSNFAKLLEMLVRCVGVYLTVFINEEQAETWIRATSPDQLPQPSFDCGFKACRATGNLERWT